MDKHIDYDLVVVGGGIVGLASAYKLAVRYPHISIAVIEKEPRLAFHQTGRNSGVIHSGIYYNPESTKARTCLKGRAELIAFAQEHKIPHEICGKVIIASTRRHLRNLEKLYNNGKENELEGLEKIGPERIQQIEPSCTGALAGLYVPSTGIIDFVKVAEKLAELIVQKGKNNVVLTEHEVKRFDRHDYYTSVITNDGDFKAKYIINCAGLESDRIARADGIHPEVRIVPFRGDYYRLAEAAKEKVKNLIYPVPEPALPFLGVHFTRMLNGDIECGPNAVFSFKREGYGKKDFSLKDSWESLSYFGTLKLFARYCRFGIGEYARVISKKLFLHYVQRLVPSVTDEDIIPCRAGVRAQAVGRDGKLVDDFIIERQKNSIHVLNAPSPAATASLAIGEYVQQLASEHFKLEQR